MRYLLEDLLQPVLLSNLLLPLMSRLLLLLLRYHLFLGCGLQSGRWDLHIGQQVILVVLTCEVLIIIRNVAIQDTCVALDTRCRFLQAGGGLAKFVMVRRV